MRNINHTNLEPYISSARLSGYYSFFLPNNQVELIGCYLWGKEVAAAFFPILQALEVTLRNSIHKEAHSALGAYWFDNVATRRHDTLNQKQLRNVNNFSRAISETRNRIRYQGGAGPIPEDKIVAKVTFGVWTNLFSYPFEVNRNPQALWPRLLRPVFPNAPQKHRNRANFQSKLLDIKTFRNKAFHHEPVWNIGRPATIEDSIARLLVTKDTILELIKWMSLESLELVEKAGYVNTICRVCSLEHLEYLKHPGNSNKSLCHVKRELRGILRNSNKTTDILLNGSIIGKLTAN